LSVLALFSASSIAQQTTTTDAGAGVRQEMDHDARGRIVESRTIGADGRLLVKINYTYSPEYDVVTTTTNISYWPDGTSVEKKAQTTFDESNNFRSEIVEDFDLTGKHVSGHQVFHDPITGIFRCFNWNVAQQKHIALDCPESEEAHAGPKDTPKSSRDAVLQHLAAARQAAQTEEKSRRMKLKRPIPSSATIVNREFGVVLPARLTPGERVSGRVVDDPDRFAHHPELLVTRVTLPLPSVPDGAPLTEWTFELKGTDPQSADGPVSFVVPVGAADLDFTLRQSNDSSIAVSSKVPIPSTPSAKSSIPTGFQSPALCFKRDVCVVSGSLSGDSRKTFAAFDSVPVLIVAETRSSVILDVPRYMNLGPADLIVTEGDKVQAMTMVVADLWFMFNREPIEAQQEMITILRVDGVQELSDEQWRYGVFPPASLERARALVPGFNPAKTIEQERERREKQEKKDGLKKADDKKEESAGMVLLVVNNATPDVVSTRGAAQQSFVFYLTPESFAMGEFKYDIVLDSLKSGTFALNATAIPFLAPVKAQVFVAATNLPH
jgi:hypothetical protein